MTAVRQKIIAGNWKMYKTIAEAVDFVKNLIPLIKESPVSVYLAVPFTVIKPAADQAKGSSIFIGAQNMNDASEGAFTGEIAARMLKDAGAQFVILGHSERRHLFHESSELVNKKVRKALSEGLQPIVCIGETASERADGATEKVLQEQLLQSLAGVSALEMKHVILAYEPVWAIGTGQAATPEDAEAMHRFCRKCIADVWGEDVSQQIVIQYGGSVKPANAKAFMDKEDVDGLLVGGASLTLDTFSNIIHYHSQS